MVTQVNLMTRSDTSSLIAQRKSNIQGKQTYFPKMDEGKEQPEIYNKLSEKTVTSQIQRQPTVFSSSDPDSFVPYAYLATEGIINYNGITFVCDKEHHAICLGDMSNPEDVLNIPLTEGGSLKVNRNNFGDLSKAITMFSPEDIKRIMEAIALDTKIQQMKNEIEDDKNSLGDSADTVVANAGAITEAPGEEQIALLFLDREEAEVI